MTHDQWNEKRERLAAALVEQGVSPVSAAERHAHTLTADLFGPEPMPERWEHNFGDVAVEIDTDSSTVDVKIDTEWAFLAPQVAREMAAALVDMADRIDGGVVA
jgi:hypothetical protein